MWDHGLVRAQPPTHPVQNIRLLCHWSNSSASRSGYFTIWGYQITQNSRDNHQ